MTQILGTPTKIVSLILLLGIPACSFSSSDPQRPAPNTTIVVPSGSSAVCADGTTPPCR